MQRADLPADWGDNYDIKLLLPPMLQEVLEHFIEYRRATPCDDARFHRRAVAVTSLHNDDLEPYILWEEAHHLGIHTREPGLNHCDLDIIRDGQRTIHVQIGVDLRRIYDDPVISLRIEVHGEEAHAMSIIENSQQFYDNVVVAGGPGRLLKD